MTKKELIKNISDSTNLSQKEVTEVVNATFEQITVALTNEEKVQITGFGTFETRKRAARTGLNPATGQAIEIAATTVPAFKAGKALKDAVNK